MRAHRGLVLAGGLAATAIALSGCTASPGDDDTLTVYVGRAESLVGPLIEQFEEETGIQVEARYAATPELTALVLEEGDRTPAEVFLSQDAGALGALSDADLVTEIPADLADQIPAGFTSTDGSWVGVTGRARVLAYDSEQLTEDQVPSTVDDLTADEWGGQVAFAPGNASFQSFITALRVLEGEEAAAEWVAGMADNEPELTENNLASLDLVNTGQAQIGLINHYYWYRQAAEVGAGNMRAQLKFLPGDPGGIVNVTGAAILKGAADDADARAFVEFLISEQAQRYFVEETFEYPLLPGIDAPEGLPALESLVNPGLDLSDLHSVGESQRLLADNGLI
ncbi:extracellular solute-binding protein [Agromyces marinus]|uniref:Iron ABC transporter substrate-binding protein n=1 Tax=Agromyces marinus TaxID=1389020 RepID=A0ABM8H2K4_9MICO|nr:extracellular solute-binding protein [Agromyces marinus]UIP59924.1 Iron-utilization periplasmic protein [Agromyces marinus]BDZ54982.1 iron ABC transporter substrate-binding protein [Agromyces marinus]